LRRCRLKYTDITNVTVLIKDRPEFGKKMMCESYEGKDKIVER